MQKSKILTWIVIVAFLAVPQSSYGWHDAGHRMVARIAWDNLDPHVRQQLVDLLMQAPSDSCLRELLPNNGPLEQRQRQFFVAAATWPDKVRPKNSQDHRICTKYNNPDWHFVDHFWSGTSGDPNDPPHDRNIHIAETNAAERLALFRNLVNSSLPAEERAIMLGWMLHLVGDIHQPLHTSGRVTTFHGESAGDRGGNHFKLGFGQDLHSYWDGIIEFHSPPHENFDAYVDRISRELEDAFPLASFDGTLEPGNINAWVLESLQKAKDNAYPKTLKRNQSPSGEYEKNTFDVSRKSIAESGYRLANLLNKIFGPAS
jgi:S1/P1 nuclease